jgi:hypothetical protein
LRFERPFVVSVVAAILLSAGVRADAQETGAEAGGSTAFLPRASFVFEWASLIADDKRFDWQGRVGVDFDITRFGRSRLNFRGSYEAVLGRERRLYDLNQSTYVFEAGLGHRFGGVEIAALLRHVSRHVVDRENAASISWNLAGVRAATAWTAASGRRLSGGIEIGRYTQPAFVDYAWTSRAAATLHEPLTSRLSLLGRASGEVIGVDRSIANRPRICGGRLELVLRVNGRAAAFEIFGGYERRIDAFPTDRFRVRWFTVGFRVVGRE